MIAALEELWHARASKRGFHPEPLPRDVLVRLFAAAQLAPSWCNIQPWRVAVTEPPVTRELATSLVAAARMGLLHPEIAFPASYPPPYDLHRATCGKALYRAMGIARDDREARDDAWLANFAFFGAPHVAIVACDKRLGPYALVDLGVWLGYLLTAAQALGVDACPMASLAGFPEPLRARLPIAETDVIVLGIALGRADSAVLANGCRTSRQPIESNVTFVTA